MRAFFSLQYNARHQASPSVPTRSFCESILFVRLEALRGSERRVVRIVGMVGLKLDETRFLSLRYRSSQSDISTQNAEDTNHYYVIVQLASGHEQQDTAQFVPNGRPQSKFHSSEVL